MDLIDGSSALGGENLSIPYTESSRDIIKRVMETLEEYTDECTDVRIHVDSYTSIQMHFQTVLNDTISVLTFQNLMAFFLCLKKIAPFF